MDKGKSKRQKKEKSDPETAGKLLDLRVESLVMQPPAVPCPKAVVENGFTVDQLVEGLQSKRFAHVSFMVGAGISVAAGIPDFRTPVTGLYAQVKKLGLPVPEDIFSLDVFLDDPQPFYSLASQFLFHSDIHPVLAHRWMREFDKRKQLNMVYTQNIDGLELDAGISPKKVMQAHGHTRSAHCCNCKTEYTIDDFRVYASRAEVWQCPACANRNPKKRLAVNPVIKPDIIFFGEKLGKKFESQVRKVMESDLVVVMGTSLQVAPFSTLVSQVPEEIPMLVLNREMPKKLVRNNVCFLQGDIEDSVRYLVQRLQWALS